MLSWIIAIVCLVASAVKSNIMLLIAAGLFAIAGSIELHK